MDASDVLVMTTLDAPTYQTYARTAAAVQSSIPALLRHTLSGLAPTLAEAATCIERGQHVESVRLYAAVTSGDMVVGGESRTALTAEAVAVHAAVTQTVARTRELLARSQQTCATAAAAVARTRRAAAR